jgi:hypothetical protein
LEETIGVGGGGVDAGALVCAEAWHAMMAETNPANRSAWVRERLRCFMSFVRVLGLTTVPV